MQVFIKHFSLKITAPKGRQRIAWPGLERAFKSAQGVKMGAQLTGEWLLSFLLDVPGGCLTITKTQTEPEVDAASNLGWL